MSINEKRNEVVSLLRKIDRKAHDNSTAALRSGSYSAKSTRFGLLTVERLSVLLTDYDDTSTWGQTADQLWDRLRLDALDVHDYEDPFNGRPFHSSELNAVIDQLEQYQEGD